MPKGSRPYRGKRRISPAGITAVCLLAAALVYLLVSYLSGEVAYMLAAQLFA